VLLFIDDAADTDADTADDELLLLLLLGHVA